jgi:linoleoyl-CoA desaturase
MKVTKFSSNDPNHQEFGIAIKKNVYNYFKENNISTKGDASMLIKSIIMILLYLVPFAVILTVPMSAWLALFLTVVMGIGLSGIGMAVMHDAVHGAYSEKEWVNKWMGNTIYLLGDNVFNWKIQHNVLHHTYTGVNGLDEDVADKGVIRLSQHLPLRKIHYYQHIHSFFFYGLMTISKLVKGFEQLVRYEKMGFMAKYNVNPRVEMAKVIAIKSIYLFVCIILPALITPFAWWQALLGFLSMHFVAGMIMSIVFQLAHVVEGTLEEGTPENDVIEANWTVHELLTTSDFAPNNRFLTWYAGGLNFQVEHHLFPNICHIHYPKIAPIVAQTAREYGIPYNVQPTFGQALMSHVRKLKELGQTNTVNPKFAFAS